jgi:hypothetical protein
MALIDIISSLLSSLTGKGSVRLDFVTELRRLRQDDLSCDAGLVTVVDDV